MKTISLKNPSHLIALGFGTGLMPKAPGTWGTLVGIPLFILMSPLNVWMYISLTLMSFILGCYVCHQAGLALGEPDHGSIVWDEVVGFLITMSMVPFTWTNVLLGFALFRLFDITKPFPIKYFDKHFKNGFGVMLDDVLAGIMANIILQLIIG